MLLGPIEHFLQKAISPRSGYVINLLNIYSKHRDLGKRKKQENIFSMKEQEKSSGELNKMEISNLPYKEIKETIIRILTKISKE